jgi:Domain of unknown function (DUF4124)
MYVRNLFATLAIGAAVAFVAAAASAQQSQVYRWKDSSGVTHFSQTPPADGANYTKVHLDNAPDVSSNPTPAPQGTATAPEADRQVRRDNGGSQPNTPSNRARLCQQLNSNIALLQSKQPVVTSGANGSQQVMSDDAREQRLATARAQRTQYCSGH